MPKYILKRCLQLIPILLGITFLSFGLMRLAGGDAVTYLYENNGTVVSDEIIEEARQEYGLDQPFIVQYGRWLAGFVTGDMGISYVSGKDVAETFLSKLPATLLLTLSSTLLTLLIAIPLGILTAVYSNSVLDYIARILTFAGTSMPNFFAALVLMYFLAVKFGMLPAVTNSNMLQSLILPTLTLAIPMSSRYTRQVRAAMLEELGKPYVRGMAQRGVSAKVIITKNALRCALLTILPLIALSIGSLLGGTTVVETIFMWDGVGKMAVDAITTRDYPIVQAYVAWMAIIYVFVNLISDLLHHLLDPRVRLEE